MSCLNLGANPALFDVLSCGIIEGAGGWAIASLLIFILLLYGMYKARVPFVAIVPIFLVFLFVFAGAGITAMRVDVVYTSMMWIALSFVAIIIMLAFWKLRRPF